MSVGNEGGSSWPREVPGGGPGLPVSWYLLSPCLWLVSWHVRNQDVDGISKLAPGD